MIIESYIDSECLRITYGPEEIYNLTRYLKESLKSSGLAPYERRNILNYIEVLGE